MLFRSVPIGGLLGDEVQRIEAAAEHRGLTGAPSGLRDLDKITSGFQKSNLIILAARPAMGKTSMALGIARHLGVAAQVPVVVFSLEMSREEVAQRFISTEAKVDSTRMRSGDVREEDWTRIVDACNRLSGAPIYVDDTAGINLMEIRSKTRRLKMREPDLGLVIVDYLQLMSSGSNEENRVQEISQISRQLKVLARDLDVPVIALSQLSRAVESRTDKRPLLSDLRESGSIEQDADVVMFIYRDDYYNKETSEKPGQAELIVAKHRNGAVGSVDLAFIPHHTTFADLARGEV